MTPRIIHPADSHLMLIDILSIIERYKASHPGEEVFLDGDLHAFVAREVA
jgi:hypothetical protein